MELLNKALLSRLGWKLTSNQPLFWVDVLRSKYLKHGSFLSASANLWSSWLWNGLLKNQEVDRKGACISISIGSHVNIWNSPWIPLMHDFKPRLNTNLQVLPDFCVDDLILPNAREWNKMLLMDLFYPLSV
jgi:hypothetical protein